LSADSSNSVTSSNNGSANSVSTSNDRSANSVSTSNDGSSNSVTSSITSNDTRSISYAAITRGSCSGDGLSDSNTSKSSNDSSRDDASVTCSVAYSSVAYSSVAYSNSGNTNGRNSDSSVSNGSTVDGSSDSSLLRVVNDLSFVRGVLYTLKDLLLLDVVDDLLLDDAWNVFSLVLDGVVVLDQSLNGHSLRSDDLIVLGDESLNGNLLDPFDLVVFDIVFLVGDVLQATLSWDLLDDSLLVDGRSDGSDSDVGHSRADNLWATNQGASTSTITSTVSTNTVTGTITGTVTSNSRDSDGRTTDTISS